MINPFITAGKRAVVFETLFETYNMCNNAMIID